MDRPLTVPHDATFSLMNVPSAKPMIQLRTNGNISRMRLRPPPAAAVVNVDDDDDDDNDGSEAPLD